MWIIQPVASEAASQPSSTTSAVDSLGSAGTGLTAHAGVRRPTRGRGAGRRRSGRASFPLLIGVDRKKEKSVNTLKPRL